jgi:hypothetical protein
MNEVELGAEELRAGTWIVRPVGQLGTCGYYPVTWTAQLIKAYSENEALNKATPIYSK